MHSAAIFLYFQASLVLVLLLPSHGLNTFFAIPRKQAVVSILVLKPTALSQTSCRNSMSSLTALRSPQEELTLAGDENKLPKQMEHLSVEDTGIVEEKISKKKLKKSKKLSPEQVQLKKAWEVVVRDFQASCLDDSFINFPVRSSTVKAAADYSAPSDDGDGDGTLMPGSHKHLGGAYDPTDGCIYGVPANSKSILCLVPQYAKNNTNNIDGSTRDNETETTETELTDNADDRTTVSHYKVTHIPLPPEIAECHYKWLRGIFAHGCLWAIPAWANCVLCFDVDAYWGRRTHKQSQDHGDTFVQLLPLPTEYTKNHDYTKSVERPWQWHGAGINHEKTAIFCIPSNAQSVLKVDLLTRETSLIPISIEGDSTTSCSRTAASPLSVAPDPPPPSSPVLYPEYPRQTFLANKWYGGIVGADNCVYGIPYRSCAVLKIDCCANTAQLVGPDYGINKYNWHGGICVDGKIYAHPSHASTVLVLDTNPTNGAEQRQKQQQLYGEDEKTATPRIKELPIMLNGPERKILSKDDDQTYKWLGGSVGADGNIYCPACDTSAVLKINIATEECTTFGFAGTLKNKWQGGLLGRDGCIYCIPASGVNVLRILTVTDQENALQLVANLLPAHKDKWQGGYEGKDGSLYFIPENGYRVLKVTPPVNVPRLDSDGNLPDGDVVIEML